MKAPDEFSSALPQSSSARTTSWPTPTPWRRPRNWSTAVKGVVLTVGVIGFFGSLLAFPAFADMVFWVLLLFLIGLSVLIVLGASPF